MATGCYRSGYGEGTLKRQAFTLIELLIVIAIIAVLAALLFPVMTKAKDKAQETRCVSNLKQMGMAVNIYRADHDGTDTPGTPYEMGFPVDHRAAKAYPLNELLCRGTQGYAVMFGPFSPAAPGLEELHQGWKLMVEKLGSATPMFVDPHHNLGPSEGAWSVRRAIAVRLDGSVRPRTGRYGPGPDYHTWWLNGGE